VQVEIWSDVICPWCYVGKRRFEQALERFDGRKDAEVIWRSFELDQTAPQQYPGTLDEMLAMKYDVSIQQAAAMNARVTAAASEVGLGYRLSIARPGNTFDAHRLLHFAASRQLGTRATERIMHAYFCEGLAVGDRTALVHLAPEFGIAESEAHAMLESSAYSGEVRADEARAAAFGITGVPFFVLGEKLGISGAQPSRHLQRRCNRHGVTVSYTPDYRRSSSPKRTGKECGNLVAGHLFCFTNTRFCLYYSLGTNL
jgi:predicted DsbA family dithiol-disulfide isomerase